MGNISCRSILNKCKDILCETFTDEKYFMAKHIKNPWDGIKKMQLGAIFQRMQRNILCARTIMQACVGELCRAVSPGYYTKNTDTHTYTHTHAHTHTHTRQKAISKIQK